MSWQHNPKNRFLIKTPNGWESFAGIQKLVKLSMVEVFFKEKGVASIKCSPDHPFIEPSGRPIKAIDLIEGDPLLHAKRGYVTVEIVKEIPGPVELYDPLNAGKDNVYYANGVLSHNCEFIGSSNTLIDHNKLELMVMAWKSPLASLPLRFSKFVDGSDAKLDVHVPPVPGHQYVLTADVAGGKELDASAFIVFDITAMPYQVVAKYQSDKITPMLFPDVIEQAATKYNSAYVMVETNDNDVAKSLQMELEYENIITTTTKGKGTQVGGGFTKNVEFGLRSNKGTKRIGCGNLKTLIESDKLLVYDYQIINELTSFISVRNSYAAEEGKHDDLAMCLVNFGWLVNQKYFKELTDTDVYSQLKRDYDAALEDDLVPFGFISTPFDEVDKSWGRNYS